MNPRYPLSLLLAGLAVASPSSLGGANLIAETTIIDNIPIGSIGPEDGFGNPGFAVNRGDGVNSGFIDAAVLVYDFGAVTKVNKAELTLDVDILYTGAGQSPTIELFTYADDGLIQLADYFLGAGNVRDSFTYNNLQVRTIDVTDAVNDALQASQYVGFRFQNSRSPFQLPNVLEGIHYKPVSLDYSVCATKTYCNPADGNPGNVATISTSGCDVTGTSTVDAANVPANQNGYLIVGDGTGMASPNQGTLCVIGPTCIGRYTGDVQSSGAAGTYSTDISNSITGGPNYGLPAACSGNIAAGETWYFQYWHRLGGGQDTFSEAICIMFQ